jgi:transposase-like protein
MKAMVKHRTHSTEFKRQIAQEFIAGEILHGLAKRHDLSRNLIRILVARYEAGAFDDEARAADLLQEFDHRPRGLSVAEECRLMGLPRSTYYDATVREADDAEIVATMKAICDEFEAYGYRRVGAELRQRGIIVNSKKIRRLMREHDLQPTRRRRFVATTDSSHDGPHHFVRAFGGVAVGQAGLTGPGHQADSGEPWRHSGIRTAVVPRLPAGPAEPLTMDQPGAQPPAPARSQWSRQYRIRETE